MGLKIYFQNYLLSFDIYLYLYLNIYSKEKLNSKMASVLLIDEMAGIFFFYFWNVKLKL